MNRKVASIIVFVLAAIILALGIYQTSYYLSVQNAYVSEYRNDAKSEGADAAYLADLEKQLQSYLKQQVYPQAFEYIIQFLFYASLLAAVALLLASERAGKKPAGLFLTEGEDEDRFSDDDEDDLDDLFEEPESQEEESVDQPEEEASASPAEDAASADSGEEAKSAKPAKTDKKK